MNISENEWDETNVLLVKIRNIIRQRVYIKPGTEYLGRKNVELRAFESGKKWQLVI